MATLREHIEAIRDELTNPDTGNPNMLAPESYRHAVAALAILDFKPLDSDTPKSDA